MALIRWDPFMGLTNMHSQLDDMFNNMLSTMPSRPSAPATDVYTEDDKVLVAEVHAPGFNKEDISVQVHDGMLEIKGEKHDKEEEGKKGKRNYMMRESHASFYRSIALPKVANGDEVEAHFDSGILKVRVPFKALPEPKRVAISDGKRK